jgi:hypothetical protein
MLTKVFLRLPGKALFGALTVSGLIFSGVATASASEALFTASQEWKLNIRGEGAVSDFEPIIEDGAEGVLITFDFEGVDSEVSSVWVGVSGSDSILSSSTGSIKFRTSSEEGCRLKFSLLEEGGTGYDKILEVHGGGSWEEHEVFLDPSSFDIRWGKAPENETEITFPLRNVSIHVVRTDVHAPKGAVKIVNLPAP